MSTFRTREWTRFAGIALFGTLLAFAAATTPAWSGEPGKAFETPDAAAKALVEATAKGDDASMLALFGSDAADLIQSGDPAAKARREDFVRKAKEALGTEAQEDGSVLVVVGTDRWPLPIPLVKSEGGWRFDVEAGREEIRARIIGANELGAIELMKDLVASQEAYEAVDRDGDGVREYAQRFLASEGQKDGLWWPGDEDPSPLGLEIGDLLDDVAKNPDPEQSVYGYRWKMLKAQGAKAPGGAYSYVINGNQVAGYAFVAVPAKYGETAIMSLLVGKNGKLYEKDLGEAGLEAAKAMEAYEPDDTWSEVAPPK